MEKNTMILGKNQYYSLDCHQTKVNNNVIVLGCSGAGKTRGVVIPNLLQATGSYLITDPKGNLYNQYKGYLESKGYEVKKLDFTDPKHSAHYNFFKYIRNTQDIVKVAHMLIYQEENGERVDPFWDQASQLLIQACMAYLKEEAGAHDQNLRRVMQMVALANTTGDMENEKTPLDILMEDLEKRKGETYTVATYNKFRVAADKTLRSILISINARLGLFDTPEIEAMTDYDEVDIPSLGTKKKALFVVVSDTDRSMDGLVNIFFAQAMNELCRYADQECRDNRLPVPVRFIMDDFATNVSIPDFPRLISSIRSRNISTIIMLQAESQLTERYRYDGKTIIANCDTYVYMGGNDVETAQAVAERCDVPMKKILNMPVGKNWIFRRGQEPVNGDILDLDQYLKELKREYADCLEK